MQLTVFRSPQWINTSSHQKAGVVTLEQTSHRLVRQQLAALHTLFLYIYLLTNTLSK